MARLSAEEIIAEIERRIWARDGRRRGKEIYFRCLIPGHNDHHPSARWNPIKRVWRCDVCDEGGGWTSLASCLGIIRTSFTPIGNARTRARFKR